MNAPLRTLLVLAVALGCASTPKEPSVPVQQMEPAAEATPAPESFRPLENRFNGQVVRAPTRGLPLVVFRIAFRAGSIDDPPGKEGLTALTADLMTEGGTRTLSSAELIEALFPMAADISAVTDKELTVFAGKVHADHLETYLPLLLSAITEPRWDPKEFERLRDDALQDLEKRLRTSDDENLGKAALDTLMWRGHPYAHPELGTSTGLRAITLDDCRAHAARVFTRDRMVIGVGGEVTDALVERLQKGLAALPEKGAPLVELPEPKPPETKVLVVDKDAPSSAISLGYPWALRRDHPDFFPMMVAVSALGEHRQFVGRLMKELRMKRGLNYGDYAYA
ncbi:MAG: M16 family metallopeptidase [Myxococcales bacterium]